MKLKGLEALRDVADGNATKIYMPTDMASIVSTLGVVGESLGIGDKTKINQKQRAAAAHAADPCVRPTTSREGVQSAATGQRINRDLEQRRKEIL